MQNEPRSLRENSITPDHGVGVGEEPGLVLATTGMCCQLLAGLEEDVEDSRTCGCAQTSCSGSPWCVLRGNLPHLSTPSPAGTPSSSPGTGKGSAKAPGEG